VLDDDQIDHIRRFGRILSKPIRLRILLLLEERPDASASELERKLKLPNTPYHLRLLESERYVLLTTTKKPGTVGPEYRYALAVRGKTLLELLPVLKLV
jgi:DNA-binding transcriptional ArsR family regulator